MNNALCRALLVILQAANPSMSATMCNGNHGVFSSQGVGSGAVDSARLEDDGTIVVTTRRLGAAQTQTRIAPTDPGYQDARREMGDVRPGDEVPFGD